MVAQSTVDQESVAILRDYVHELMKYVDDHRFHESLHISSTVYLQLHGAGAESHFPTRIRDCHHPISKLVKIITHSTICIMMYYTTATCYLLLYISSLLFILHKLLSVYVIPNKLST